MNDSETSSGQILRLTFSVEEVAQLLGLSRSAVYEAIARGDIPALRFGRRIVIVRDALDRLLDQLDHRTLGVETAKPA